MGEEIEDGKRGRGRGIEREVVAEVKAESGGAGKGEELDDSGATG